MYVEDHTPVVIPDTFGTGIAVSGALTGVQTGPDGWMDTLVDAQSGHVERPASHRGPAAANR